MKLQVLELTEEDRAGLLKIVQKGRDWRMRDRAQTLLYFGDGWRVAGKGNCDTAEPAP